MRPPHSAGENNAQATHSHSEGPSFNEAPAFSGGKLGNHRERIRLHLASMRPPHSAGENDLLVASCKPPESLQ